VQRVRVHLDHRSKDKRAYASEVLELLLDREQRAILPPLLDDAPVERRLARLEASFPQARRSPQARLRELPARSPKWLSPWTRAVASRDAENAGTDEEALPMLLIEKVIALKTVPMFEATSEELLAEIAGIVEVVDYAKGSPILTKGELGDSMYIVVSGRVRVFDGPVTLSVLDESEIFGELALLDPAPRSASVEADSDVRLFRLDGDMFTQLMAANVDIVRGVLHVLCERLRRTSAASGRV
jgi:CRP/FNR family cyclic AMP-dependent transcriptional regulator